MKRDIIIIEDKTVSVTGNEVWMTAGEIAEEFHATVPAVNAAIKAVTRQPQRCSSPTAYPLKRSVPC